MNQITYQSKLSPRELCYIGFFVAIIALCAQITIPLPGGVPFTLQAWAVGLSGLTLGAKKGAVATFVYVLLGFIGAPVFVGFTGGVGMLFHPTAGFILSFPVMAFLAGLGSYKNNLAWAYIGLTTGVVINFICGLLFFSLITSVGLLAAFGFTVLPFIFPTIIKLTILPLISKSILMALGKARLTP